MAAPDSTSMVAYPCLVRADEEQSQMTFSLPQQKLHHINVVPEVPGDHTCFLVTPQGWILIVDISEGSAFLLQPQTGSRVELPPLGDVDFPEQCRGLLSGNDGSAPGCGILILYASDNNPSLLFCRVGGRRWSKHSYDIGCFNLPKSYCPIPQKRNIFNIASSNGRFFFYDTGDLGTLDFTNDDDGSEPSETRLQLGTIAVPRIEVAGDIEGNNTLSGAMTHLLESGGDLYYITVTFYFNPPQYDFDQPGMVRVHKMDFSAPSWQRIHNIGDRAFLCGSPNFGASCSASKYGLKANRLYWTNAFKQDKELRVYHLKDGSLEEVIDVFGDTWTSDTEIPTTWIVPVSD